MVLKDKVVVVTGGTGSMGKTFVRRALSGKAGLPKKIIVLSRDEAKQHYMRVEYMGKKNPTDEVIYQNFKNILEFRIGDVRNYADVVSAIRGADIVVNAAALKQVPTCEYFPEQALMTNCLGAANIVRAISEHQLNVETVMGVSTDKACKPVNVMGMTKALQERIFISANILCPNTRFICVRYGNVLASRGSVIPLFHEQIRGGGPITITDVRMTRFLLSLEDAVDTVLAAIKDAKPGDTYIPIVPTALMVDVAKAIIGQKKIEIKVTGIRPGEKLHESLISQEEAARTYKNGDYYVIQALLPELLDRQPQRLSELKNEYCSDGDVMTLEQTRQLLEKHNLIDLDDGSEYSELVS